MLSALPGINVEPASSPFRRGLRVLYSKLLKEGYVRDHIGSILEVAKGESKSSDSCAVPS